VTPSRDDAVERRGSGANDVIPQQRQFVVASGDAGMRLDVFLSSQLGELSRSQIQRLIREGRVLIGQHPTKPSEAVSSGAVVHVTIPTPAASTVAAEALPLSILFEDDDLVVIDKPAGLVVHPAAGHANGTLVNALLYHVKGLSGIGGQQRPGIVHRLDRGTSGVMVVAKHDRAHQALARQFHDRAVGKEYAALVWGTVDNHESIRRPIGRDPHDRLKMSSRAQRARPAVTHILDVEPLGGVSLIRVSIATGRTHQIRVHLSETGHPVVGDALYSGVRRRSPAGLGLVRQLDRPFLHAARLAFNHPVDGRRLTFDAPLPPDLSRIVSELRQRLTKAAVKGSS
jgi:23S rRNA pseudouridine1911/1915/1917 synthase